MESIEEKEEEWIMTVVGYAKYVIFSLTSGKYYADILGNDKNKVVKEWPR